MGKILLISCNLAMEPYPVYPLGLTMVAEASRAHGHEVAVWDPLVDKNPDGCMQSIRSFQPDVIGISLRNIDNTNSAGLVSYTEVCRDLVRDMRRVSASPIVLGGAGFSLCPEPIMSITGADYGVVGEGEAAFPHLVDCLCRGEGPCDSIVRSHGAMVGSEIGTPQREAGLASHYLNAGGMLNIQTKRGCPNQCAYCSYPLLEGLHYRFRPAESVVDEMEMLRDKYGADYLAITDSVFNDGEGKYLEVAEEMVRRDLKMRWMAFFRPQHFQHEEVALLKRSGLECVEWGTDCATDETLGAMGKGFSWSEVVESNRMFHNAGICGTHFLIFGGPNETKKTLHEGLKNVDQLDSCVALAYCGIRILPGTQIQARAIKEGIIEKDDDLLQARFYFSPHVKPSLLESAITESFGTRRDRIFPPGRDFEKVQVFHNMGYRGPIWDLLLKDRKIRSGRKDG